MIEAKNLKKVFASNNVSYEALKGIDISIKTGECVAIMGRSGSGKSTLMHILACLDTPTEGEVMFDGVKFASLTSDERNKLRSEKFGFVFQQFHLDGRETVFENVVMPLRIRGEGHREINQKAKAALDAVELSDKATNNATDLSGGEKQRVCIARAIIGEPSIIFADEPTGNLDTKTGEIIEDLLFKMNRERGITLIIVTHDNELARKCERIIELSDGRIVSGGNNNEVS